MHSGLPHGAAQDLPSAMMAMRNGGAGTPSSGRAVRTIVFHGDADRVVNPANAAALIAQATSRGRRAGPPGRGRAPREGAASAARCIATPPGARSASSWTLHGAGHAWAGGDAAGSHADSLGPDASREMLRFFLET